jgi:hypothetical protein
MKNIKNIIKLLLITGAVITAAFLFTSNALSSSGCGFSIQLSQSDNVLCEITSTNGVTYGSMGWLLDTNPTEFGNNTTIKIALADSNANPTTVFTLVGIGPHASSPPSVAIGTMPAGAVFGEWLLEQYCTATGSVVSATLIRVGNDTMPNPVDTNAPSTAE